VIGAIPYFQSAGVEARVTEGLGTCIGADVIRGPSLEDGPSSRSTQARAAADSCCRPHRQTGWRLTRRLESGSDGATSPPTGRSTSRKRHWESSRRVGNACIGQRVSIDARRRPRRLRHRRESCASLAKLSQGECRRPVMRGGQARIEGCAASAIDTPPRLI